VTGRVDDIRPYLDEAAVYVVPLRIGGGVRLKLLEAMAMGKAIVSTSVGAEGLDPTPGENILIADDADTMAAQIARLLHSKDEREKLAGAARMFAEQRGSWKRIVERLESVYYEVCRQS